MAVQALNIVVERPWLRDHVQRALEFAEPAQGKTYWDWRDSMDDSFYAYVLELRGQILYVGQTAKGADARLRDHKHPAANAHVVRRFGFVQELARISVRTRHDAMGVESALWHDLHDHGYMTTMGRKPRPRPDFEYLPHNRPAAAPAVPPSAPSPPLDPDEYFRVALEFLWMRSQGSGDGQGVRINRYGALQMLLAKDEWSDADRHLAWKILNEHPRQISLCADLEGQPIPPAPRIAYPAVIVSLKGNDVRFGGRGLHPALGTVRRLHGPVKQDESGALVAPQTPALMAFLRSMAALPDVQIDDAVVQALA
ncbi:MAG: hypothetical protein ACYC2H_01065 [Thermoplasmatota archaeon]